MHWTKNYAGTQPHTHASTHPLFICQRAVSAAASDLGSAVYAQPPWPPQPPPARPLQLPAERMRTLHDVSAVHTLLQKALQLGINRGILDVDRRSKDDGTMDAKFGTEGAEILRIRLMPITQAFGCMEFIRQGGARLPAQQHSHSRRGPFNSRLLAHACENALAG